MRYAERANLQVDSELCTFIERQVLHDLNIDADGYWAGVSKILSELTPKNKALLQRRDELQNELDAWHIAHRAQDVAPEVYEAFLRDIGYIEAEGPDFAVDTAQVDPEIAHIAGPQLVVPITNARFALNAANARWGSLYDALYGTDALGDAPLPGGYDEARGARVIAWAKRFLDGAVPLAGDTQWADVTSLEIREGALGVEAAHGAVHLAQPAQYLGYLTQESKTFILFESNGLKIEVEVNSQHVIGASDPASIASVNLESAISTIMDCEDSVATVDAQDKILAYHNWLGLMRGTLESAFDKGGKTYTRRLSEDRFFNAPDGSAFKVKRRSLMLIRNVGHLMTNPAILDAQGDEVFEGLMDAIITTTIALYDLRSSQDIANGVRNSDTASVYVVKPKMHGSAEVAFTDEIFSAVEALLGLPKNTVKIGIMDEERRTSVNLKECIRAAKSRIAFINTGFLDRTGDEIHSAMEAGPMIPKGEMKAAAWIASYENRNVDIGLACGLKGKAQIGKGMWAMPDRMGDMLAQKTVHPQAGANCAWVPSPTAATLHATHYHQIDVAARQDAILAGGARGTMSDLLTIPVARGRNFSDDEIGHELRNNAQGILGYVVRWIDQGVGCSKVPDLNDVGLMEDRATCRISAQALANWLHHGVVSEAQIKQVFKEMAVIVDAQNADDPEYQPMARSYEGHAFKAALELVLEGRRQPSGYTEPVLHAYRRALKAQSA